MKNINELKREVVEAGRLVSLSLPALAGLSANAVTNDLVITSITRQNNCTSLTWNSHPGEFYTVQWTDNLTPPIFWRVAEVNVPSQGTNTIWYEGGCSQTLMAVGGGSESTSNEPSESKDTDLADDKPAVPMVAPKDDTKQPLPLAIYPPGIDLTGYIIIWPDGSTEEWSAAVVEKWRDSHRDNPQPEDGGEETTVEAQFYRVARSSVTGIVDGWNVPTIPSELTNVLSVATGAGHCLALRSSGTVVAWGNNYYGQSSVPTNLADVVSVAAGWYHSVALKRDGSLASWGYNFYGQVTNAPAGLTNVVDVKAGAYHTVALKSDGSVAAWGAYFPSSNAVPAGLSNVVAIAAGTLHCLALKSDGTLTGWAFWPGSWPTNAPSALTNVAGIAAGRVQNYALLKSGEVVTWNNAGFLTNAPAGFSNIAAIGASEFSGLSLRNDSTLTGWGGSQVYPGLSNVVAVALGGGEFAASWLCIVTNTDALVIRQQPQSLAIPVGTSTNIYVSATGASPIDYQWSKFDGTNWVEISGATNATLTFSNFQDSNEGTYRASVSNAINALVSSNATLIAIHAPVITNQTPGLNIAGVQGGSTNLAIGVESRGWPNPMFAWYHGTSQLPVYPWEGLSKQIFFNGIADEGSYRVVVSNPAGSATSAWWQVTVTLQGEATGWGNNGYGQANRFATETNFVAVSAGGYHTLGLRENGTVLAWGNNSYGQTNVSASVTNIVAVAAGLFHNLALTENGSVIVWGDNTYGQTNVPSNLTNAIAVAAGGFHSLALRQDGTVAGWGSAAGTIPSGLSNVTAVAAGYGHSIALLGDGSVVCWGDNGYGQTNAPSDLTNAVAIAAGAYHSLAVRSDGAVVGWGANSNGETTPPTNLTNALKISAGYQYSLALRNDGSVAQWGTNTFGPTNVPAGLGDRYAVSAGYYHEVALAYSPVLNYPVSASRDVLLVYNATSSDSISVGNYYLQNRPKFAAANFTGLSCTNGEILARSDFTNQVLNPILQWLTNNPTKRPAYLVFSYGLPWRFEHSDTDTNLAGSIAYKLRRRLSHRTPFITQLNMATTSDCIDYIDKVAAFGAYLPLNRALIRASDAGFATDTFVLDNVRDAGFPYSWDASELRSARDTLVSLGVATNAIQYADNWAGIYYTDNWPPNTNHIRNATNCAAYVCWGIHGFWPYSWPTNVAGDGQPYIAMRGNTGWQVMQTIESFNGFGIPYAIAAGHSSFQMWFSAGAFGGANYSNTPAGAVSHVDEPTTAGVNATKTYVGLWFAGKGFGIAAWQSSRISTQIGQTGIYTSMTQATGDPLVSK